MARDRAICLAHVIKDIDLVCRQLKIIRKSSRPMPDHLSELLIAYCDARDMAVAADLPEPPPLPPASNVSIDPNDSLSYIWNPPPPEWCDSDNEAVKRWEADLRSLQVQARKELASVLEKLPPRKRPPEPEFALPALATLPPLLSAADLARQLRQPMRRVETFLRRYHREEHQDCRTEVPNPRKREPKYLYRTADVWPALLERLPAWRKLTTD
jgi:hypothetical protein